MYKHSKLFSVLSYITWVGWFIAFFCRDRGDTLVRRHLNQGLVLALVASAASLLSRLGGVFGALGGLVDLACFVLTIMGIVRAVKASEEPLPLIGTVDWIQ